MKDKFPEAQRSFATRLEFLHDIFSNLYTPHEIIAGCIQHKLDRSYLAYVETLDFSILSLKGQDPLDILKNMD